MTNLVLGASGQLGLGFRHKLNSRYWFFADRKDADLKEPESLATLLNTIKPNIILNCAAYTAVDLAECEPDVAFQINSNAVSQIAEWSKVNGAFFVHFSTDYVFDGRKKKAYLEVDEPQPLSVYGQSKRFGEVAFLKSGCDGLCLRTSWLYSHAGESFFLKMYELFMTREEVAVVNDQVGVPTSVEYVTEATLRLVKQRHLINDSKQLMHVCPSGQASWFEFASVIHSSMVEARLPIICKSIKPVPTLTLNQIALRPENSRLSNKKLISIVPDLDLDWEACFRRVWKQKVDAQLTLTQV